MATVVWLIATEMENIANLWAYVAWEGVNLLLGQR